MIKKAKGRMQMYLLSYMEGMEGNPKPSNLIAASETIGIGAEIVRESSGDRVQVRGEESACPHAVTVALIKDYYIQYFRLYLLLIYHYTLSVPGYGNNL